MATYDIIILGAGAMGSAAAYHAANAGLRVLARNSDLVEA